MTPLAHRLPRELRHNLGKYLGIFVLFVLAIMFTSGFLNSAASIADIAAGMRERYRIEDCYVVTLYEAPQDAIDAAQGLGATLHENFSRDLPLEVPDAPGADMSVRVYANRDGSFDAAAYAQGRAPQGAHEIALDRVFCANHKLRLGDEVRVAGEAFELVGICTLADYQVTYKNGGDFMFNATSFTVAQLEPDAWKRLVGEGVTYRYSVLMDDRDADLAARTSWEERLVDALNDHGATVTDLVDREANIGLTFAANDVEGDSAMWETLMLVLIVIMAFVFVVLTDATIEQESAVIGTLLASGYRTGELIAHYMVLPVLIGLLGCTVGEVLGLTLMTAPMQALYYNSYSFPPFELTWHWRPFIITTVVPLALLAAITWLGLVRKLHATPLQFLRNEASAKARTRGARLPERLRFVTRFRLRVFLRNATHFVTLFFGIMFGSLLLLMGLAMLPVVSDNADLMAASVPAAHLYTLKADVQVDATQAQRDAWGAAWELSTNPAYAALDLDYLADTVQLVEDAGVDLAKLGSSFDAGAAPAHDGAASGSFRLPQQLADAVEDSVTNRSWHADDPAILALWRQVATAAGVALDCSDAELANIIRHLDTLHVAFHSMGTQAMGDAWKLVGDLMDAAADPSVDLSHMDRPVNQSAIDRRALDQTERFYVTSLEIPRRLGEHKESVTVYGIEPHSRYWTYADVDDDTILAGAGVVEKCAVDLGVPFVATDKATNESYELTLDASCNNATDMNLYLSVDAFERIFGDEHVYGLASDVELPLDERYVASDLTPDKMRSMADQMQDSMGGVMRMMVIMVVPLYFVLIYLLTKTVIDRSARAISYMKVFGYHDGEINGLYLRAITLTVAASLVLNVPLLVELFRLLLRVMMADYSGNFVVAVPLPLMAQEVGIGFATYLVVAALHVWAIRRVSLALAMKVQE